ncbi:MAG: hypothetical protein V3W06_00335 [Acidimicrobiia bacterium]
MSSKSLVVVGLAFLVLALTAGVSRGQQSEMVQKQLQMAMENMAKVMLDMPMPDRPKYMMQQQQESIQRGTALFSNASIGRNGQTCNACHPGGGTTGGEAEIAMRGRFPMNPRLPIPTLAGAAATFPKYKVPNDAVITLATMDNNCIKMFMMGEGLDLAGQQAHDLAAYVSTLSNGDEVAVGGM